MKRTRWEGTGKEEEEEEGQNVKEFTFFLSWLSELWILADGNENVKYFAPVIPGVDHHNEKRKEKNEPAHSSVQQHALSIYNMYLSLLVLFQLAVGAAL